MSTLSVSLSDADVKRIALAVSQALAEQLPQPAAKASARLTIGEAAQELRCSPRQVYRLIAGGRLRATKLTQTGSSRLLVARSEIERLLEGGT